ncbi:hypothetical protein M422DRAFT_238786 [Sphaerobolus stellatus SS14]|nr:hypothetical protein M422DRAFT_238786 [Sphaerobolus stellatus SS14]
MVTVSLGRISELYGRAASTIQAEPVSIEARWAGVVAPAAGSSAQVQIQALHVLLPMRSFDHHGLQYHSRGLLEASFEEQLWRVWTEFAPAHEKLAKLTGKHPIWLQVVEARRKHSDSQVTRTLSSPWIGRGCLKVACRSTSSICSLPAELSAA